MLVIFLVHGEKKICTSKKKKKKKKTPSASFCYGWKASEYHSELHPLLLYALAACSCFFMFGKNIFIPSAMVVCGNGSIFKRNAFRKIGDVDMTWYRPRVTKRSSRDFRVDWNKLPPKSKSAVRKTLFGWIIKPAQWGPNLTLIEHYSLRNTTISLLQDPDMY